MCSDKYNDIYFSMKITYPLSTLPELIHSTICTIDKDGGMYCIIKKAEAKRETVTQRQYQLTYGG